MKKLMVTIACFVLFFAGLAAEIPADAFKVMPPMREIYHPVSTTNPEAQKSFDRGLTYLFAFNHDIAFASFENAAKVDPDLAMAYWGMALALGQNINEDIKPENWMRCYDYAQTARRLAPQATPWEQAYIAAVVVRYNDKPDSDRIPLRIAYRDAMKKVMQQYPEDLDAATIYAESILNMDPWKWWTPDRKPKEGTFEAIDVLEFVLTRNPDHIGANHYYIHAFEESPYPERALMSAHRLMYLLPESGHLLHMPCHIFLPVGDYELAVETNKKGVEQDREYFQKVGMTAGTYPVHYLSHNFFVLARTYMLMEDYPNAIDTAMDLQRTMGPYLKDVPHMFVMQLVPLEVYLYFHKWKEILALPVPSDLPPVQAFWHYSRAMAYASLGDIDSAKKEKTLMQEAAKGITATDSMANNPASNVLEFAGMLLDATMASEAKNYGESIELLKKAAAMQEAFYYDEPPAYPVPARQLLGFALLQQQRYPEAADAFREVLKTLQRNGRTLSGLASSLKGQGLTIDAYCIEREMSAALQFALKSKLNSEL